MTMTQRIRFQAVVLACGLTAAAIASAQPLTAERAVELALQHSTQVVNAEADVLGARGSLYGAYSGLLPSVRASLSRSGAWEQESRGSNIFGSLRVPTARNDSERFTTSPSLSGSWSVLDLSSFAGLQAAQSGMKAARYRKSAADHDVVLATKRQFYEVVRVVQLAEVANGALRLARDDERRVRALFEVGSVSRSDLLKAQVRTAQSELDSLTAAQAVTVQRIVLSEQIGIPESELGEVDTVLSVESREFDEAAVLAQASERRPDLIAAEASLRSAQASLRAANFRRLPYITVQGGATLSPKTSFKQTTLDTTTNLFTGEIVPPPSVQTGSSESDLDYNASVSINLDLFTGFATESQIASARARMIQARESRDVLRRNLASEVHQAILAHREATERDRVARRALESATENLKLTQQKYNVGSATILELIDAQVQLQRAQSDGVSARVGIRVAEAQIERVSGGGAR
jgi:outer membrane protein TolC